VQYQIGENAALHHRIILIDQLTPPVNLAGTSWPSSELFDLRPDADHLTDTEWHGE